MVVDHRLAVSVEIGIEDHPGNVGTGITDSSAFVWWVREVLGVEFDFRVKIVVPLPEGVPKEYDGVLEVPSGSSYEYSGGCLRLVFNRVMVSITLTL